jgi:hypothetical protein
MRRFSAGLGVGAMLVALLSNPLFHSHDRDDHGNPGPFVHAHFLEAESHHTSFGEAIEEHHSHDHVRWIDFFTFKVPEAVSYAVIEVSQTLSLPTSQARDRVTFTDEPRAHSPPTARRSAPRSPPAI